MTRDELLKLEPGTLVDVYDGGAFVGTHTYNGGCNGESALVVDKYGNYEAVSYLCLELHTPQPQVSGTIEITMKLKCLRCREEWSISVFARRDYPKDRLKSQPCPFCDYDETRKGAQ